MTPAIARWRPMPLGFLSGTLLSFLLLASPTATLAHAGHGDEFQGGGEATQSTEAIQVDAETAQRLDITVEPATPQQLAVGIKTTGQIETLPSKQVEVTAPIAGATVVELLVEPGASVTAGQPIAVLSSPNLVELRVTSQEKRAEGEADLQQARADLQLAQQNYERLSQIAAAEIAQAQSQVTFAREKFEKDKQLAEAGALPRRQALESQTQLVQAQAELTRADSRREVIDAEARLKRARSAVEVAQSRIRLSEETYQTRLSQLGTRANDKGLVTVTAPISGRVADREATLGQSFQDAGGKLMTITNDNRVFATANIYEKDLGRVKVGQKVNVRVVSQRDRIFSGRIATIGSAVEGETRVVPVKAEVDNAEGILKPGMFAELEVLTDRTATPILAIPSTALVEANNQSLIYVKNGNAYQAVEVSLGQTSGDKVEVKSGLFEGDLVVTEGAMQLYAQSLRGGKGAGKHSSDEAEESEIMPSLPWWWAIPAGGGVVAIAGSAFWLGRRTQRPFVPVYEVEEAVSEAEKNHYQPQTQIENLTATTRDRSDPR